jgi:flagellar motor switch protein FliN
MSKNAKHQAADAVLELLRDALTKEFQGGDSLTVSLDHEVDAEWPANETVRCVSVKLEEPMPLQICLAVPEATQAALVPLVSGKSETKDDWPKVRGALDAALDRFTRNVGKSIGQAVKGSEPTDEQPGPDLDYRAAFRLTKGDEAAGELWIAATREQLRLLGERLEQKRARPAAHEAPRSLDALMDVELPVSLSLGSIQVPLGEVLSYSAGAVVKLGCAADAPVSVVVNGRPIAKGVVVAVDGKYAVRISEILREQSAVA